MPGSGLAHMGTTGWGEDRPDTSGAWGHETRDTAGMSSQTLKEAQQEAIRDQVCSTVQVDMDQNGILCRFHRLFCYVFYNEFPNLIY